MGEEYHIRGAPRIPPFVVVVSVLQQLLLSPFVWTRRLSPPEIKLDELVTR